MTFFPSISRIATTWPTPPLDTVIVPAGIPHDSATLATATWIDEHTPAGTLSPDQNALARACILSKGLTDQRLPDFAISQLYVRLWRLAPIRPKNMIFSSFEREAPMSPISFL